MKILTKTLALIMSLTLVCTAIPFALADSGVIDYVNSDSESYGGDLVYFAGNDIIPVAYREEDENINREFITDYPVSSIAVYGGYAYVITGRELRKIDIKTLDDEKVYASRSGIDSFSLGGGVLYLLINGGVFSLDTGDNSLKTVIASDKVKSFWLESANMLCYMTDDAFIFSRNLYSGKETARENIVTDLGERIPLYGAQRVKGALSPDAMELGSLQNKFPGGEYWNHAKGSPNNPDKWTSNQCTHHSGNCDYSGSCGCNSFSSAIQCMGYAFKCGYDVYGSDPRNWTTYTSSSAIDNVKAGDVIRYRGDRHSIFVTGVSGNTITFTDCNWDGHCQIQWNKTITKSSVKSTFTNLKSAPYAAPGSPSGGDPTVEYTVSFNVNGGSGSVSAAKYKGGDKYGELPVPEREGYDFTGWYTSADGGTKIYADDKVSASVTLYAHWQIKVYYVTFDKNGGNYAPDNFSKIYGESKVIGSRTPTRDGYTFVCWNTAKDGSGTSYKPGATYSANETVTLYAIWQGRPVQLYFDANGGSYSGSSYKTVYYGGRFGELPEPVRNGYDFTGWHLGSETGELVTSDTEVDFSSSERLYASWKVKVYTIKYDANGGTGAPPAQYKTHGKSISLSNQQPSREHYSFLGWFTSTDASGTEYRPGETYTANSDIILFAGWEGEKYTISFNANGGENAPSSQTKTHGTTLSLTNSVPVKTGCSFVEWNTRKDGSGSGYKSGSRYSAEGSTTLYAIWEIAKYKVIYDAQGGTNAPETQIFEYDSSVTISAGKPSRTGFIFKGWFTQPDGAGKEYKGGDIYAQNSDLTLCALWEREKYLVTFNANGGTGAPDDMYKEYGLDLALPGKVPSYPGYDFVTWYSSSGSEYSPGSRYYANSPLTLYARWTPATYKVTFNANGAKAANTYAQFTYGTKYPALPVISRTGYTFAGWYTQPSSGTKINAGDRVSITSNSVFYAHWNANTYVVSFDPAGGTCDTETKSVKYGSAYGALPVPTKYGFVFGGWFDANGNQISQTSTVKVTDNSSVLTAKWIRGTYTLILDPQGGTVDTVSINVAYQSSPEAWPQAVRNGYTFGGWAKENGEKVGSSFVMPGENVKLHALWTLNGSFPAASSGEKYTLTWKAGNAKVTQEYAPGEIINLPALNAPAGYVINGFDKEVPVVMPDSDLTLTAVLTPVKYAAVYINEGEQWALTDYTVESLPAARLPQKDGYTCSWQKKSPAAGGLAIMAEYKAETYTAVFTARGSNVAKLNYTLETDYLAEPAVPEWEGYTGSWPDYELTRGGITVNADYKPNTYSVTFVASDVTVAKVDYTYGVKSISEPEIPEREGYTAKWAPYTLGAKDSTVKAVYTPIEYTATFIVDGSEYSKVKFTVEKGPAEPVIPPRAGYMAKWSDYTAGAQDITVTAKYIPISKVYIKEYVPSRKIEYNSTITFRTQITNAPKRYEVRWFINGEDIGTGNGNGTITLEKVKSNFTICAAVYTDGEYSEPSETETVYVDSSIISRIISFLRIIISGQKNIIQ